MRDRVVPIGLPPLQKIKPISLPPGNVSLLGFTLSVERQRGRPRPRRSSSPSSSIARWLDEAANGKHHGLAGTLEDVGLFGAAANLAVDRSFLKLAVATTKMRFGEMNFESHESAGYLP